jgi:hypothetical protein
MRTFVRLSVTGVLSLSGLLMMYCASAQIVIKGTVFDISQKVPLTEVTVVSKSGPQTTTDSLGVYKITLTDKDSLYFSYLGKRSPWFAVKDINNPWDFDVALRVYAPDLPEIYIRKESYREDSIANRREYEKIFDYQKPGVATSTDPSGSVGLDLDAFINMFRFNYNRRQKGYQQFFEWEEHEKYIDHRFNRTLIKKITNMDDEKKLDAFIAQYRPTYDFVEVISEIDLGLYIQKCKADFDTGHPTTAGVMMNTFRSK